MESSYLYLLGAGASCEFLPLAADFSKRMMMFSEKLEKIGPFKYDDGGSYYLDKDDPLNGKLKENLIADLRWLSENASNHASVDTYAKKLYFLDNKPLLHQLKATVSSYLIFEQSIHPVDKRYDSFFASILEMNSEKKVKIPDNLRILTWNYDTQIEKSFFGFCEDEIHLFEETYANKKVFHINGFCGKTSQGEFGEGFRALWKKDENDILKSVIESHKNYSDSHAPADIRFAWEYDTKQFLENTLDIKKITDLIIVGYSFPYFNRAIDQLIFSKFIKLKRIYLQFPEGVHKSIKERLKLFISDDVEIIDIFTKVYFHIPDNFDIK